MLCGKREREIARVRVGRLALCVYGVMCVSMYGACGRTVPICVLYLVLDRLSSGGWSVQSGLPVGSLASITTIYYY